MRGTLATPGTLEYERPDLAPPTVMTRVRGGVGVSVLRAGVCVGVAVWLGSLVHLLLTVSTLFRAFPKATSSVAVEAAPAVFNATEVFLLVVAGVTLCAAATWCRLAPARTRSWLAWLLAAAAALAFAQHTIVTTKMNALREAGQGASDAFGMLHGVSSSQYLLQTALVLAATVLLPAALSKR